MIAEFSPAQIQTQKEFDQNERADLIKSPLSYLPNHRYTNGLLVAASRLLIWMVYLKELSFPPSISSLQDILIIEIKKFERSAYLDGYDNRTVLALRYCLCTALDEAILSTKWGISSAWTDQTLLNLFHREAWGGERFYVILNTFEKDPLRNSAILEIFYILLALGFKGKFFDKEKLVNQALLFQLFQKIRPSLRLKKPLLLKTDQGIKKKRKFFSFLSFLVLLLASLLILESIYEAYLYKMEDNTLMLIETITKNKK